jgi:hypothetical protein
LKNGLEGLDIHDGVPLLRESFFLAILLAMLRYVGSSDKQYGVSTNLAYSVIAY